MITDAPVEKKNQKYDDLPVLARQPSDRAAESGLVLGFDLFADGARVYVPGGDLACGEPQSIGPRQVCHQASDPSRAEAF